MSKARPVWPASAAQLADWSRLAEAPGSLRHALALREASGEPAGRRLSHVVFHVGLLLLAVTLTLALTRYYSCWRLRWCGLLLLLSTTLQAVALGGQLSGAPSCSAFAQAASAILALTLTLTLSLTLTLTISFAQGLFLRAANPNPNPDPNPNSNSNPNPN